MERLFAPESVLVVGVSTRAHNMGRSIVRNLIDFGYVGEISLFGRRPGNVYGHRIRTEWEDVPRDIDLGVLLVPAPYVPETLDHLGERGIRRAVISTSGFVELGADRQHLQEQVVAAARRHAIRFIGPNGLGVMNLDCGLCTAFAPLRKPPHTGGVHVLAQSGGVGMHYLSRLAAEELGLGTFVSLGNKLDLDECDVMAYLNAHDPELICLYLEDIRNGRRLFDLIRDCPCPVLVHKTNVSEVGARAAASHTASIAGDDRVVTGALRQAGAVRARDTHHMLNAAKALSLTPMRGNQLLVVSRSGGHAVIAADLTEAHGFDLPPLTPQTAERVQGSLRAGVIRPTNPLDLGDIFDFEIYARILEDGLRAPNVDGVVFIHVYHPGPETASSRQLLETVRDLSERYDKPVFLCLMTADKELIAIRHISRYPVFTTPEDAVRAAAASRDLYRRSQLPVEEPLDGPALADPAGVAALLAGATGSRLLGVDAMTLAERAGFPTAPCAIVRTQGEVAATAERLGFPLALKVVSADLPHKTDVGGVVLGVRDVDEAVDAYDGILGAVREAAPEATVDGVMLQRMEHGGVEVFLGGKRDPSFGPVVMVGLGGVTVELFRDVSLRLAPLTPRDIDDMLEEVVSFRALRGVRGLPPADLPFLRDAIARMAQLIVAHPEIDAIDLNPLKLHREGRRGRVVDARVVLATP